MIIFVVMICFWNGKCLNIIDILGYVDFIIEVECFLCVFDGVVCCFDVNVGVELQIEMVWCQVDKYQVLCMIFVNKMDKFGVDFYNCVGMVMDCLGFILFLVQLLIGFENEYEGLIDLVKMKEFVWQGENLGVIWEECEICVEFVDKVAEYCEQLVEIVVEQDEVVMEVYLEGEELIEEKLKELICQGMINLFFVLIFCGMVFKNKGVQLLFDVVVDFLLSLVEILVIKGIDVKMEEEIMCLVFDDELILLLVFKIMNDLFVGLLMFVCMYFGYLEMGMFLFNMVKDKKECIGCMLLMYFNFCEDIKECYVGDIVVIVGLKDMMMGDILFDFFKLVIFECMEFLDLVIELVIELKLKVDQEKLGIVLQCLVVEDLFFCMKFDEEFG